MKNKENIKTLLKNAEKVKVEFIDDFEFPAGWEDFEMEFVPAEPRENGGWKYKIDKEEGLKTVLVKNGKITHRTIIVKKAEQKKEVKDDNKPKQEEIEL